jgi:hypothetical protein
MIRNVRRWCFLVGALVAASGTARAEEAPTPRPQADETPSRTAAPADARREVVLALGYGSIVLPQGIAVYRSTVTSEPVTAFDGFSVDVTRRFPLVEVGARFWSMRDASDGKGASAHMLTRLTTEARFYPWRFRTLEPWVGAELGLALADDFAIWDKTEKEPAHRAVADTRPGFVAGLEAGGRLRLASLLAVGLRGGLLFLGFDPAGGPVSESPQTAKYFVQPVDWGRRVWLSAAFTAELTVPD